MATQLVTSLRPHPLNDSIYGDRASSDLVESIKKVGVLNPLLITADGIIISGHRRWAAASAAGLLSIPVVIFHSTDALDIEEALIESNRQREKTNEQIGREYDHLKRVYSDQADRRASNGKVKQELVDDSEKHFSESSTNVDMKPTQRAAEKLGISQPTANKAAHVVHAIDGLRQTGQTQKAEVLRTTLNQSVDKAYKTAQKDGLVVAKPPVKPQAPEFFTVQQWQSADDSTRSTWLTTAKQDSTFNKTNDNIEWAGWSWNPVTGCLHNCSYCYARDIATRFYTYLPDGERFTPVFYPARLGAPARNMVPDVTAIVDPVERMARRNVFVCSMADLFGKWVPTEWIEAVLQQARDNPQWNFLFLTKFPIRMAEFEYPPNTWIGTTVDSQHAVERAEKAFSKIRANGYDGVAWLSCEPMMERLTFSSLSMFDWVVVGGSSESTQTAEFRPDFEWIVHLWNQAKSYDLPVYMKTNLGIEQRVREYPVGH